MSLRKPYLPKNPSLSTVDITALSLIALSVTALFLCLSSPSVGSAVGLGIRFEEGRTERALDLSRGTLRVVDLDRLELLTRCKWNVFYVLQFDESDRESSLAKVDLYLDTLALLGVSMWLWKMEKMRGWSGLQGLGFLRVTYRSRLYDQFVEEASMVRYDEKMLTDAPGKKKKKMDGRPQHLAFESVFRGSSGGGSPDDGPRDQAQEGSDMHSSAEKAPTTIRSSDS
ncbi:hypothetical protein Syun_020924 [Stephania yunnanensis]|uniref:Uncharacterized protein n=1 Tax=Stephania yunnanensis TaxID=152371 RepID=A0AAP0NNP2_9MAGN